MHMDQGFRQRVRRFIDELFVDRIKFFRTKQMEVRVNRARRAFDARNLRVRIPAAWSSAPMLNFLPAARSIAKLR